MEFLKQPISRALDGGSCTFDVCPSEMDCYSEGGADDEDKGPG